MTIAVDWEVKHQTKQKKQLVWYLILLYTCTCDEIHLIQPIFLLENTTSCIRLLT